MSRKGKKQPADSIGIADPALFSQGSLDLLPTKLSPIAPSLSRTVSVAVCGLLLAAVFVVFGQTTNHDFVNFDDEDYVYANLHVRSGLTGTGVAWAITAREADNWHPLTWLSHMLDYQLYGMKPGGHHLTNVLLHATAVIVFFLALSRMTGSLWASGWVAAVFAIHPLRVESVAWIGERKDVLSGLLFMSTLWSYARYVERPSSWGRYLIVVASFALGLTAKPMLVTLPFVLLLLDYWPLGRIREGNSRSETSKALGIHLLIEKIPLFILAGASCAITIGAQRSAMKSLDQVTLPERAAHAATAYLAYIGKMIYPSALAVFYPLPKGPAPFWEAIVAVSILLAISIVAIMARRKCPYLLVGWFWYLGMLVPVIGLVQVGNQAMADRYTYLTQIGLYFAFAWGIVQLAGSWPYRHLGFAAVSVLTISSLIVCAWNQTRYWRDSEALWTHALASTSHNSVAHNSLGNALSDRGLIDEAFDHYLKALEIDPDHVEAQNNVGIVLARRGQIDAAISHYRNALTVRSDYMEAHYNLANALAMRGQWGEAIAHYRRALELEPNQVRTHYNLGLALASCGLTDEAMAQYRTALEIKPDYAEAHNNLGVALAGRRQIDAAIAHYRKALEIKPDYADALVNLGNALAGSGHVDEAISDYQNALKVDPDHAETHNNLAVALAGSGRLDEAIVHFRKALEIKPAYAEAHNNLGLALVGSGQIEQAIAQYRNALEINADYVQAHYNLGNAFADLGKRDGALEQYHKALDLATIQNDSAMANLIRGRVKLYESVAPAGKP